MQVTLTKLRPGPVQLADIPANIAISSISPSPMCNLYHTIKSVYQPLLCSGSAGQGARVAGQQQQQQPPADNKLEDLLLQLEAGLGSALRMGKEVRLGTLVCICLLPYRAVHSLKGSAAGLCQATLERVESKAAHQGICLLLLVVQVQPGHAAPAVAVPAVRLSCSCTGIGLILAVMVNLWTCCSKCRRAPQLWLCKTPAGP